MMHVAVAVVGIVVLELTTVMEVLELTKVRVVLE